MTLEEALKVELLPGVTVAEATPEQLEEHAARCERMAASLRAMSNQKFAENRDIYEAWEKQRKTALEACNVLMAEAKRRGALK